jgi:DNA-binding beta-propeller fold protein YncE
MFAGAVSGESGPGPLHFLVANDDALRAAPPSTVSFYTVEADGHLSDPVSVSTDGNGMAGGYLGIARIVVSDRNGEACIYAANAQSENITGIDAHDRRVTGLFHGTLQDVKIARDGIGLALGETYLYATFSGSGNIAAFRLQPDCKLDFAGEVHAQGLSGGRAEGMAVHGNTMVVTYGDGSVGSFGVAAGVPIAHDDAQYLPGVREDFIPGAVDISRDGHYAIFGGGSTASEVQVSDISSGKIMPPKVYKLGPAWSSDSVRLSPDESLLYVSNSSGGRVTVAFFERKTGQVRQGCTSDPLKGFYAKFTYIGAVATELPEGVGGILYVPEYDANGRSNIGLLRFTPTRTGCTLTELEQSPVAGSPGSALLSIAPYPPRPF